MRRFYGLLLALGAALNSPYASGQEAIQSQVRKLRVPAAYSQDFAKALSMRYRTVKGVTISADRQTGELVVLAPPNAHVQIASDVQTLLDGAQDREGGVRLASLTPGEPLQVRLANVTWREFEDGLQNVAGRNVPVTTTRNGERASFQLTSAPLAGTTVEVDRRGNSVTVIAPEPKL